MKKYDININKIFEGVGEVTPAVGNVGNVSYYSSVDEDSNNEMWILYKTNQYSIDASELKYKNADPWNREMPKQWQKITDAEGDIKYWRTKATSPDGKIVILTIWND